MLVMVADADKRLRPGAADARERPGYALPSDLEGSLRHLDDGELDRLLRAVAGEARRRGRPVAGESTPPAAPGSEKPAAIARELRLSRAQVEHVIGRAKGERG